MENQKGEERILFYTWVYEGACDFHIIIIIIIIIIIMWPMGNSFICFHELKLPVSVITPLCVGEYNQEVGYGAAL